MSCVIWKIREHPELLDRAAAWFHEKWGVPLEAYRESMAECYTGGGAVPQWYAAVDGDKIIGGMGVIENDFHDRKELTPNVCAVYVEEARRCQGIAGELLGLGGTAGVGLCGHGGIGCGHPLSAHRSRFFL